MPVEHQIGCGFCSANPTPECCCGTNATYLCATFSNKTGNCTCLPAQVTLGGGIGDPCSKYWWVQGQMSCYSGVIHPSCGLSPGQGTNPSGCNFTLYCNGIDGSSASGWFFESCGFKAFGLHLPGPGDCYGGVSPNFQNAWFHAVSGRCSPLELFFSIPETSAPIYPVNWPLPGVNWACSGSYDVTVTNGACPDPPDDILTDCCSNALPTSLTLTVTGAGECSCPDQSIALSWTGTQWSGVTTGTCATLFLFDCLGEGATSCANFRAELNTVVREADPGCTCDPLMVQFTEAFACEGMGNVTATFTVTE